jgi:hypothetical protein
MGRRQFLLPVGRPATAPGVGNDDVRIWQELAEPLQEVDRRAAVKQVYGVPVGELQLWDLIVRVLGKPWADLVNHHPSRPVVGIMPVELGVPDGQDLHCVNVRPQLPGEPGPDGDAVVVVVVIEPLFPQAPVENLERPVRAGPVRDLLRVDRPENHRLRSKAPHLFRVEGVVGDLDDLVLAGRFDVVFPDLGVGLRVGVVAEIFEDRIQRRGVGALFFASHERSKARHEDQCVDGYHGSEHLFFPELVVFEVVDLVLKQGDDDAAPVGGQERDLLAQGGALHGLCGDPRGGEREQPPHELERVGLHRMNQKKSRKAGTKSSQRMSFSRVNGGPGSHGD